jgi:L,D-peptidoglycan transpeptidase YkuD (ErfK/YbiS/YcfS/YnhG family)
MTPAQRLGTAMLFAGLSASCSARAEGARLDELPETVRQLLVVESDGWDAPRGRLHRCERTGKSAAFACAGQPLEVALGRAGMAWRSDAGAPTPPSPGPSKREGDGRSPAGVLPLHDLWGYAPRPPEGVRLPYHQADGRWRCVDDAASPSYAQLVRLQKDGEKAPFASAERLLLPTDHYKYLVVVGYNMKAPRPGAGSCIFLHVAPTPGEPTAGCTALREDELVTVLRWLDPRKEPRLLQLPRPVLSAVAASLSLPQFR